MWNRNSNVSQKIRDDFPRSLATPRILIMLFSIDLIFSSSSVIFSSCIRMWLRRLSISFDFDSKFSSTTSSMMLSSAEHSSTRLSIFWSHLCLDSQQKQKVMIEIDKIKIENFNSVILTWSKIYTKSFWQQENCWTRIKVSNLLGESVLTGDNGIIKWLKWIVYLHYRRQAASAAFRQWLHSVLLELKNILRRLSSRSTDNLHVWHFSNLRTEIWEILYLIASFKCYDDNKTKTFYLWISSESRIFDIFQLQSGANVPFSKIIKFNLIPVLSRWGIMGRSLQRSTQTQLPCISSE